MNVQRLADILLAQHGTPEAARRAALTEATAGALAEITDEEREELMLAAQMLHEVRS